MSVISGMLVFVAASLVVSKPAYSLTGFQSIDVQVSNKTYSFYYNFSDGGSIIEAKADSMQPYGGELYAVIESPKNGYLDIVIPRELHDMIGFTDHPNLTVFVDEEDIMDANILDNMTSCDQIAYRIPIKTNAETIDIATTDILSVHGHPYPPKLLVTKNISVEGQQFQLNVSTHAARCDISFSKEEKELHIDIDGRAANNTGFFSISVPPRLLSGNLTVMVDGKPPNDLQIYKTLLLGLNGEDPNNATISFNYGSGAKSIDIIGTSAMPEFSTITSMAITAGVIGIVVTTGRMMRF